MKNLNIHKFTWLIYPIIVAFGILASSSLLLSPIFWQNLFRTADQIQKDTSIANNLQSKLRTLEAVNVPLETENFTYLLSILPASKQVPILILQLQNAAVATGTILESYRFDPGEISATPAAKQSEDNVLLSVTYLVSDMATLKKLLVNLTSRIPLLLVRDVHFQLGKVELKIDALWSPLVKLPASVSNQPLPTVTNDILRIKQQFASSLGVVTIASAEGSQSISPNPF